MKIGTVSKMTGLSPSGIRYLEQQGLLYPSGGRKGTYRSYSLADVSTLLDYRNYRHCGLSQEEILKLFNSQEDISGILEQHCDELEQKLMETTRLLHFLRHRNKDIAAMRSADRFWEITLRPAIIMMPLKEENAQPAHWSDSNGFELPYADSILLFDMRLFFGECGDPLPEVGIGVLESDVLNASFLGRGNVRYFNAHLALHCIVEITEDFRLTEASLRRVQGLLQMTREQRGLEGMASHRALSRRIITTNQERHARRFDHLWIDLEQGDKAANRP